MDEKNWQNVKEIFLVALEKDAENRVAFLDENCNGDAEIRTEIESLLASHEEIEDFIEQPVFNSSEVFTNGGNYAEKHFGNYKIIREIGAGGMGAVFFAERDDGEFTQQVAIKIIRQSLADREIINRFRRERQILANLNHPNIAKLLDGGVSASGEPFLAMEYVEGEAITKFADKENLNLEARLRLFLKVCAAVQYAHRNLIVHRDLKPNNILVSDDGEPKLLDFGLAKLIDENLSNDTTQTAFRALTPAYASPEQLQNKPITTASDIYSLGIVFYELLTDARPFDLDGKSLEEIIKTVTIIEPPTPSAISNFKFQISNSDNRKLQIANRKYLKGDLDNIALMALRKEPERRYQSVEAFADDIERYLKGLPVSARPATWKYRAEKYFKRHKIGVLAACLILLSLIGGLLISIRQTGIARAEERKALREAEKSKKITGFMEKILNYANPLWYAEGGKSGGQAKIIEVLDDITDKIETEFADDADVRAELHHKAAEIYLANGNYPKSLLHAERALEIRRSLSGDKNVETAKDKYYLGAVYLRFRKINDSVKLHEEAAQTFREIAPDNANLPYLLEDLSTIYRRDLKDFDRAEKTLTEALKIFRAKDGENHYNTVRQYFHLSWLFAEKGEITKSEEYFREGASLLNQLPDATLRNRLPIIQAIFEQAKGNRQTAEKILEDFLARNDENHFSQNIKDAESYLEQFYGANQNYEKLIELQIRLLKNLNPNLLKDKIQIGYKKAVIAFGFYNLGKLKEAEIYFNESYEIYRNLSPDISTIFYDSIIAEYFFYQKNYEKARPVLEKICNFYKENFPPESSEFLRYKEMLEKAK